MSGGVCLLMIGDGRQEVHDRAYASLQEHFPEPDHTVVVDDAAHELGFAGAIQHGWDQVIETGAEWTAQFEMDFLLHGRFPLERMIAILERHEHLAQISLKRQPWSPAEKAAGGFVELNPDAYEQRVDRGDLFTEHRVCFTTNPCLYPTALCHAGWPQEPNSEGLFTHRLLEDPGLRFAIWGGKFDPPRVTHIGDERAGHGY